MRSASSRAGALATLGLLLLASPAVASGALDPGFGSGGRVELPAIVPHALAPTASGGLVASGGARVSDPLRDHTAPGTWSLGASGTGGAGLVVTPVATDDPTTDLSAERVATDSLGRTWVAGVEQSAGAVDRYRLDVARRTAGGALDPAFGTGGIASVRSLRWAQVETLVVQPDGGLLVVLSRLAGTTPGMLRLTADGSVDAAFGTVTLPDRAITASAPGGGVAVAWKSDEMDRQGVTHYFINTERVSAGGATSTPVANEIGQELFPQAVQATSDGGLVVAGFATRFSDADQLGALARVDADGRLDRAFGADGLATWHLGDRGPSSGYITLPTAVATQADGKIVVGGADARQLPDGSWERPGFLVRYLTDGTPDAGFDSEAARSLGGDSVLGVILQPGGRIVALPEIGPLEAFNGGATAGPDVDPVFPIASPQPVSPAPVTLTDQPGSGAKDPEPAPATDAREAGGAPAPAGSLGAAPAPVAPSSAVGTLPQPTASPITGRLTAHGLALQLICPKATGRAGCRGTVVLLSGTRRVATAKRSLRAGASVRITLPLESADARAARTGSRLRVRIPWLTPPTRDVRIASLK